MVIFNKKWKKYNEIQFIKNKMDLNIQKMTNHPPSPAHEIIIIWVKTYVVSGKFNINHYWVVVVVVVVEVP